MDVICYLSFLMISEYFYVNSSIFDDELATLVNISVFGRYEQIMSLYIGFHRNQFFCTFLSQNWMVNKVLDKQINLYQKSIIQSSRAYPV